MEAETLLLIAFIGFLAQLVDSAIGMAFGSLSSSLLLATGFPAHALSATVHMAEIFGGSASAAAHWRYGNIDKSLLVKLALPAVAGAFAGAYLVTQFDSQALRPWLGLYFALIGGTIILKTLRPAFIRIVKTSRETLGFIGGFLDAFGGAGWGEFVSSGMLLRGHNVRTTIGTLVTVEFMVSAAVSVVFFLQQPASRTGRLLWPWHWGPWLQPRWVPLFAKKRQRNRLHSWLAASLCSTALSARAQPFSSSQWLRRPRAKWWRCGQGRHARAGQAAARSHGQPRWH